MDHATAHRRAYGYSEIVSTFDLWQWGLRYITSGASGFEASGNFKQGAKFLHDAEHWADPSVVEIPAPGDV